MLKIRLWKWAFPLAGMAAVYLLDKVGSHDKEDPALRDARLQAATEAKTAELQAQYGELTKQNTDKEYAEHMKHAYEWQQTLWQAGKYLAGAALGYAAWASATRSGMLQAE